jgi:acyl dehydratase
VTILTSFSVTPLDSVATVTDMPTDMPTGDELASLVGHRFPGGVYRIAHWENWLLTDCTGRAPLPDGLVHPIVLFHAPILGAGTSIGELFRLGRASGASGSVGLLGYDWEYHGPLREDIDYDVSGGIVAADRRMAATTPAAIEDRVAFSIEMRHADELVARVTNRWVFRRTPGPKPSEPRTFHPPSGDAIPPWSITVDAQRMKTMAAILRDPYPVHWDRDSNERLGLGGRVINQGPLNLSYIANMLMAWAGPTSIRRLTVAYGAPVLDDDEVTAHGVVTSSENGVAQCSVWLARGAEHVVTGTAEVTSP